MQTNGKGRKKHRSLSFSLLEHRAFVAHEVRLACGRPFTFPGKGKKFS